MKALYTLEYSEEQGCFHHNIGNAALNTNGYYTIRENCTSRYMSIFHTYIKNKYGVEDLTVDILRESADELDLLIESITQLAIELEQQ